MRCSLPLTRGIIKSQFCSVPINIRPGNGNVGLATMVNSLDRRTEIETSLEGGTDLYLFYRRRIGNQDLKICAYNSVGNTRLIELKTSLPNLPGRIFIGTEQN